MNPSAAMRVAGVSVGENAWPARLASRVVLLATLFAAELIAISVRLDTKALLGRAGFVGGIGDFGAYILQAVVVFATVFLAFGYSKAKLALLRISNELAGAPFGWGFLAAHCAAMGAFAVLSALLFSAAKNSPGDLVASAWLVAGVGGILTAAFFFIPPRILRELLANTGSTWIYAAAAAAGTPFFVIVSRRLWAPATAVTFELVETFLRPLAGPLVVDPVTRTIGTQRFHESIAPACSGLEGMGLVMLFGLLWLGYFHKDYKFPQALLLIPFGMGLMFLLNAIRITALILIGNAGAPNVAEGGFHSQAGWLAFNMVALGLASVAHRAPWIAVRTAPAAPDDRTAENPTAAYLVPVLAILAAAMVSRAASGAFEWMYPLRFAAAVTALFLFRKQYSRLDWRFGWAAPLAGGLVFLIWMALDRTAGVRADNGLVSGLAALSAPARIAWLAVRTLAATVTVPIAEELAFRGFLLRRLIAADFESVGFERWTFLAVAGSSVAFGLLHGDRWIAGTFAGLLYAAAQKFRGRIGDAIVAHSVTNALIAICVLWGGNWSLW